MPCTMYRVIVKSLQDQYHCYILTGNLKIVNGSRLCKIFSKRLENKEPQNVGLKQARIDIINSTDDCIVAWCQNLLNGTIAYESLVLQQWKTKVT